MSMSDLNVVDIAALAVIVVGAMMGLHRRLSGEIANLISVVVAFFMGIFFYQPMAEWFLLNTRLDSRSSQGVAYIFVVIAAIVVMVLLRLILGRIMRIVIEESFDRVGGLLAGLTRSVLLVVIIFVAMNLVHHEYLNKKFGAESVVGRVVIRIMPSIEEAYEQLSTKQKD